MTINLNAPSVAAREHRLGTIIGWVSTIMGRPA